MENSPSPIYEKEDGWYHCDETWSYEYGPFKTVEEAEKSLEEYCRLYLS